MTTRQFAEQVCLVKSGTIPEAARQTARLAILDSIGVGLAGFLEPAAQLARRALLAGQGPASIWGAGLHAPDLDAALLNAISAHVLDFDDTSLTMRGHPSAVLVPALLALAETNGTPSDRVLDAYVVGFEVQSKLGTAMHLAHYDRGWHATATLGTLGTAAAAGWLLGLDSHQQASALGLAAGMSGGLVRNFGSMAKALQVGHAARSGLMAARLAACGFSATPDVLESPGGFIEIFSGRSGYALDEVLKRFGDPWDVLEPGIGFKFYPSCILTHPPIEAALDLLQRHAIRSEDIERIACQSNYRCPVVLAYPRPIDALEAKFSMEHALAVTFCDGRAGLQQFSDERVRDPRVRALVERVHVTVHSDLRTPESLVNDFAEVQVVLRDGRSFGARSDARAGSKIGPELQTMLELKFRECAARVIPSGAVDRAISAWRDFGSDQSVGRLLGALQPSGDHRS